MKNIKILVVYHKKSALTEGEDFLPVNAGRAVAAEEEREWLTENTTGDDTGDNISAENPSYNELTAVYWAWKNLDADYYGLMHYRRFFKFDGGNKNYYSVKESQNDIVEKIGYSPESLRATLAEYDFIAPKPMKRKSVYEHYKNAHDASDMDAAIETVDRLFPEYSSACRKYVFGRDSYFYNMFVFDKATFDRYCAFLFGVLDAIKDRFDGKRMFISERLTGIFITKLIEEGKKGAFLPTLYVEKKPKFKDALCLTKKNLALRNGGGIKSLVYAFKPLLEWLLPSFIFRIYRNRH